MVYDYDPRTGKLEKRHTSSTEDAIFMDEVDDDIQYELKNPTPAYASACETWREYWLNRCEQLHYWNPSGKDEPYIQYIINKRREAGLSDIPEIDKRQFRSQWKNWTNTIDEQLSMEAKGLPPLSIFSVDRREMTKTWPQYWKVFETNVLGNPAISRNGVEYINNRRRQMGLKTLE